MSSAKKLVVVFGATGNQGGSIISLWKSSPELQSAYSIRAITRDVSKPSAQSLKAAGAEVEAADLSDASSLSTAVKDAYAVFALTNYWEVMSKDTELAQGKAIADAAFAAGVKHLIWSSLPHTTKLTSGALPNIDHFVAKAEVEEYIEAHKAKSNTLASYYMPAFFMSNFKDFINRGPDGVLAFAAPYAPTALHPLIDIKEETGSYVWGAIEAGSAADGVEIQAVSDWKTGSEIASILTAHAGAGEVKFAQLPRDMFKGFLVAKMGDYVGEEMTQNMDLIGEWSYYGKGTESKQSESDRFLYRKSKTSLEEYVKKEAPWKFGGEK